MYSLEELEKNIKNYPNNSRVLPRSKRIVVRLAKTTKYVDICVLSNIQVGLVGAHMSTSKFDKPFRVQKLKAHIEELKNNPNAKVFLGGDLFYFPGSTPKYRELYSPSYNDQVELLAELLEPIKDKIVCAYDGTEETKIFEKDGLNLTKKLMEKLGLSDRYMGQMAEVDFIFQNEYTGNASKTVNMLFDHGFLVANVMNTVAKKTEGLQDKINGKDFYFTSHYNKIFIEKTATLLADNQAHMVKKPCYFVSVGGYRDYPNRLTSNRNVSPANTDNGMIRVFVTINPDRNNIRGNNYLSEPQYKVCQEYINFGRSETLDFDFKLIEEIARLNEQNILNRDMLATLIEEKIEEINKQNAKALIEKYYGQKDKEESQKSREQKHSTEKLQLDRVYVDETERGK